LLLLEWRISVCCQTKHKKISMFLFSFQLWLNGFFFLSMNRCLFWLCILNCFVVFPMMCCYTCINWSVVCLVVIFGVPILIQFYNAPINEFQGKIVLKSLSPERRWKFIYEPIHQDVRILSKKIPVTKFLNLQVWFDPFPHLENFSVSG